MDPTRSPGAAVSPAHKSLGKHLRMLRTQRGLTQGDIEKKTGLLRGHISRVENGHVMPSLETLQRFADALQVPLHLIFYTSPAESTASSEVPEATLQEVLERYGERASPPEEAFLRKLKKISARLTDADRELLLMMAKKVAGLEEDD